MSVSRRGSGSTVVAVLFRASDTIVSVRLGEALALAQDRSFIATVGDRTGMLRSGQGHAQRLIRAADSRVDDAHA